MDDARRRLLADSMFFYCSLEQVAEQISSAGARFDRVYVERRGGPASGWSLRHGGGPYPLLREVAQLLDVSYHSLILPFGPVDRWTIVLTPKLEREPDSWGFIEPASDASVNLQRILEATASVRSHPR
jgi:hypothetical protein